MAPPQSYLDVTGRSKFSRFVNLTDSERSWHPEFSYFGANVYAYLLARYSDVFDLISLQLYESYSRAMEAVAVGNVRPSAYLYDYMDQLASSRYWVSFSDDPTLSMEDQYVVVPISKLVLGLGNGWALRRPDRTFFADLEEVKDAWIRLQEHGIDPRGFMFWTIDEEGTNNVSFSKGLRHIVDSEDSVRRGATTTGIEEWELESRIME